MWSPSPEPDPPTQRRSGLSPNRRGFVRLRQAARHLLLRLDPGHRCLQRLQWCARGGLFAGSIGFGLSVVDQVVAPLLVQQRFAGAAHPTWWHRLAAASVVGSGYAAVALVVSLLATTRKGSHRIVASTLVGLLIALLFAFHALATTTRVLSGSFLTLGTIEFALTCESRVLTAVFSDFVGLILGLGLCTIAVAVAVSGYLLRGRIPLARERSRAVLSMIVIVPAVLYGSVTLAAPAAPLVKAISRATPELAFLASLEPLDAQLRTASEFQYAPPEELAHLVGPPQTLGADWSDVVRAVADEPHPNVLLLVLESVPASHTGYLGYRRRATPHLDVLASRSVRMRRVWATATHSNYAQMAILSSLFPRRGHGLDVYERLDYPRVLMHDVFHLLHYRTSTFSSQDEDWQGMRRFQTTDTPTTFWHSDDYEGPHVYTSSDKAVPDAITVDNFLEWLQQEAGTRWSAYVNLQSTHFPYRLPRGTPTPFQPTGPIVGPYYYFKYDQGDRAVIVNRYDNALRYLDEQLGRIERYLEESGQLDDTLWVITADHGELFGEQGIVTHGRTLREGELRVPLLLHWPRKLVPRDVDEPVSHMDILPTVLELVGVPPHPAFQGTSFARLRHHREENRAIFFNIQGQRLVDGVLCWPWKLVAPRSSPQVALFDLAADPRERKDLAADEPFVAARMSELLLDHVRAQIGFHQDGAYRESFFAPRLLRCPVLPLRKKEGSRNVQQEFWQPG